MTSSSARLLDHQGHAQRAIVERQPRTDVPPGADEHDRCVVVPAALCQLGREPANGIVRITARNLHEKEESLVGLRCHPLFRGVEGL